MSIDFIKSIYYEILSYFVPQRIKYKIEGNCNMCGECCRQIRAKGLRNEKELKFMQMILPHYKRFYIIGQDEYGELILSCKYLSDDNLCTVYEKRPRVCRSYPQKAIYSNKEMPDGCGFKVLKKDFKDYL